MATKAKPRSQNTKKLSKSIKADREHRRAIKDAAWERFENARLMQSLTSDLSRLLDEYELQPETEKAASQLLEAIDLWQKAYD